jgi:hypothetical protein
LNVESIPLPKEKVGSKVGRKFILKRVNMFACSSEEVAQKNNSKRHILQVDDNECHRHIIHITCWK